MGAKPIFGHIFVGARPTFCPLLLVLLQISVGAAAPTAPTITTPLILKTTPTCYTERFFFISGWLWKQGGRYKSWKRRWFILNDNCLYYFEFTTDKEPRGIIPLENIRVREVSDRSKQHCFELFSANNEVIKACKTDSEGKVVEGKHSVYRMSASTEEEKDEWIKCIQ